MMDRLWRDLRYAARSLRSAPAFALAALATFGLGIGATTAVFSVVNAAILEPPPYPDPHRLLAMGSDGQIFHYLQDRARSFERVAAHGGSSGWNLAVDDRAEYVTGVPVSEGFFDVLGVPPLLGRGISPAEDQANGPPAVILSERLWRRLLGGTPDAIGQIVLLGGVPHAIVGVMPAGFRTMPAVDLWTPLRVSPTDSSWNYTVLARLASGTSPAQAESELALFRPRIHRDLRNISEAQAERLAWVPYQQWLGRASRDLLLLLLGAVACLLLIACVNVASLQLVRGIARRREMATRAALGGAQARLVQQVLTESVMLAVAGAVLGTVVADWGLRSLLTLVPPVLLEGRTVEIDWRVLGVTLGLAVGAGVLFGLAPAFGAARLDPRAALWEGARTTAGRPTMWLRRAFAIAEVALAMVLLVGAGLLIRTFVNLRSVDPGFDPTNIIVGKMSLQGAANQTRDELGAFFEQTLVRLREVPGITAAAAGNNVPVERGLNMAIEPPAGGLIDATRAVDWRYVTAEYFAVFRIPTRAGRSFDERDGSDGAPVAVVNEAFARTYFGATPAVGRFVQVASAKDPPREIVGVVADVKSVSGAGWGGGSSALASPVPPTLYVPVSQVPDDVLQLVHQFFPISWVVRTDGSGDVGPLVQEVVRSREPQLPFIRFDTMQQVLARDLEMQRFLMTLIGVFAAVSLVLATVGIYGLVAYAASQRTREIGIRMALGATGHRLLGGFLMEGFSLVLAGTIIGLSVAAVASRALSALVFGIEPIDPSTFWTVAVLLVLVTGLATVVPAWNASRTDPIRALRAE